jgi:hypothetical protein
MRFAPSVSTARLIATGALVYFALCTLTLATTAIDPYDGAYHTVLARNLAFEGRYGVWDYGRFVVWPVEVTVGPTIIVPLAMGFRLAGWGPFVPNVVCASMSIVLVGVLWLVIATAATTIAAVLSALLAFVLLMTIAVKPFWYFYLPYGEATAGLLCALAAVVTLGTPMRGARSGPWLGGVLLGLAVGAKLLVLLPGLCLAAALVILPPVAQSRARTLALFLAGAALSLAVSEGLKLWALGSWSALVQHWIELARFVGRSAGSGVVPVGSVADRFPLHARLLLGQLGMFAVPFGVALLAWPVVALRALRRSTARAARTATALGAGVVTLLAWWLTLSGQPWPRHAVIALILLPLYVHCTFCALTDGARRSVATVLLPTWCALLVAAWVLSPPATVVFPRPSMSVNDRTRALFDAADEIRRIAVAQPAARFWGSGWWRHWDVQTLVDVRFANVRAPEALVELRGSDRDYLVTSDFFDLERHPRVAKLLRDNAENCVFRNKYFAIYTLRHALVAP